MFKSLVVLGLLLVGIQANASVVSGFVLTKPDKTCQIIWGTDSEKLSCKPGVLQSANVGYIRIDFTALNLKLPPICTFGSFANPDGHGGVELVTPRLGNFSVTQVDMLFVEQQGRVPVGGAATFICDIN
jgi:hypothetical protein